MSSASDVRGAEPAIQHEEDGHRGAFFVEDGGERVAEMTYVRRRPGHAAIVHTEVSDRLAGRGVGKRLVLAGVAWARATGTKLTPRCSYARAVIERDPSLHDVLCHSA